ncbi:hypothetical protein AB6A40_002337 [Gnathostoma spinigerum]|uniref:RING-type E3 ubiquitin transferase n=1 Tax=Gnathostoma spinigerum TaxID=75299 RepID=A0ABD6EFF0_9BILA
MQVFNADASDIIRAHRRDEEELQNILKSLSAILKNILGESLWARLYEYIPIAAQLLYYTVTNLSGAQTIGEEVFCLFQVTNRQSTRIPTYLRRLLFIVLHCVLPFFIGKIIVKLQYRLLYSPTLQFCSVELQLDPARRKKLRNLLSWIRFYGLKELYNLHLAVFYLTGSYRFISQRISGIRYLTYRPHFNFTARKVYCAVGLGLILQIVIAYASQIIRVFAVKPNASKTKKSLSAGGTVKEQEPAFWFRCSVCLEIRPPACAPCGHIFCWHCLIEHAESTQRSERLLPTCPTCRRPYRPSRIVPLLNL